MKAGEAASFPWDDVLAFCLGRLRWSPGDFWNATPREIAAAFRGAPGMIEAPCPSLGELEKLMRRFPDDPGTGRRPEGDA